MNEFFKKIGISLIIGGAIFMLVKFLLKMPFFTAGGVGFITGIIVCIVLISRSRGENPKEVAKEVVKTVFSDINQKKKNIFEGLINLNQALRITPAPKAVLAVCEELIDKLIVVSFEAMDKFPDSETTFELEKLATNHLPELLNRYLKMNSSDKANTQEHLVEQLSQILQQVDNGKKFLEMGNHDEFAAMSNFLKAKFA